MRKIKFRAWNKDTKEMLYENFGGGRLDCDLNDSLYSLCSKNSDYILMQYTGIKDKNGKEIYEGDIVMAEDRHLNLRSTPIKGEIRFGDGWFYITNKEKTLAFNMVWIGNGFGEVLGNIYENPELLA